MDNSTAQAILKSVSPSEDEGVVRAQQEPHRRCLDFARLIPSSSLGDTEFS